MRIAEAHRAARAAAVAVGDEDGGARRGIVKKGLIWTWFEFLATLRVGSLKSKRKGGWIADSINRPTPLGLRQSFGPQNRTYPAKAFW